MAELTGLHARFTGDSSNMVASTKRAALELNKMRAAESAAKREAAALANSTEALKRSYDKIRASIDPTVMATKRYEAQVRKLNQAFMKNAIDEQQYAGTMFRLRAAFDQSTGAVNNMNRSIRTSRFHTANMAAQFNDIGVMLAAGQSPFMLAMQQGTQLTQIMQTMGGTAKEQFGALAGAAKSLINPMTLGTIAVIAGGAALLYWAREALGATEETTKLQEALDEMKESAEEAKIALEAIRIGQSTEEYNRLQALKELDEKRNKLKEEENRLAEIGNSLAIEAEPTFARANVYLQQKIEDQEEAVRLAREELKAAEDNYNAILDLAEEESERKRQNEEAIRILEEEAAILKKSEEERAARRKAADEDMLDRARELSEVEKLLGDEVERAARAAAILAYNTWDARQAAMAAADEFVRMQDVRRRYGAEDELMSQSLTPQPLRGKTLAEIEEDKKKKSRGGGKTDAEKFEEDLKRLQEQLMTETETVQKEYELRQEMLQQALEQKLLTQIEYNELLERAQQEHADKMTQIDAYRYGTGLDIAENFFGDMQTALSQGNDKMLKIAKVFGAAQALISAWQGYADELKQGTFWDKFARAAAVLSAGFGAVQAIKGVSSGGGGGRRAAGGGGGRRAQQQPTQTSRTDVSISVRGQIFDRQAIIGLIGQINEALGDGARIRQV